METGTLQVAITAFVKNRPRNMQHSTNTIAIALYQVVRELIEDESGIIIHRRSYQVPLPSSSHIHLQPRNLTPQHISQLLHDHNVPHHQILGQKVAHKVDISLANDNSLQEPLFVPVLVKFIREVRVVLPNAPLRGVPRGVLQKLEEEQRVEPMSLEEKEIYETCSICIESFKDSPKLIIRMPLCSHMFHQACLFKWFGRHNTCPLCRRLPYEEEPQITGYGLGF